MEKEFDNLIQDFTQIVFTKNQKNLKLYINRILFFRHNFKFE